MINLFHTITLLSTLLLSISVECSSFLSNMSPKDVNQLISLNVLESNCKSLKCEGNGICISKMVIGDFIKTSEFCHCDPKRTGIRCEYEITSLERWANMQSSVACQIAAKSGIIGIGEFLTYGTLFFGCVVAGVVFGFLVFGNRNKTVKVVKKSPNDQSCKHGCGCDKVNILGSGIIAEALQSAAVSAAPSTKTSPTTKRKMTAASLGNHFVNIDRKFSTDSRGSGKSTPILNRSRRTSPVPMEISPLVNKNQLQV